MKKLILLSTLSLLLLSACKQEEGTLLNISNTLDQHRKDAKILISAQQVKEWTAIPEGMLPLVLEQNGNPIPCQPDDLDGDGIWDELFVVLDLGSEEMKQVNLVFRKPDDYPAFTKRTNVRLGANSSGYPELLSADRLDGVSYENHGLTGEAFQMEGPTWENDYVGFRNYLDQRNGMDIFGKLTPEMVLDSVGIEGRGSYHEPDSWGMDILKVGTSLGAGSIGYNYLDSIYRVGDSGTGTYDLVIEGDLRSIIHLGFSNWSVENNLLDVEQYIEIQAGTRYYETSVSYNGIEEKVNLVTGIVNMKSDQLFVEKLNDQFTALYTHDTQSEDTTLLGMGILVKSEALVEYGETKNAGEGITQTYYAKLKADPGEAVKFRFYSVWELENDKWQDPENFVKLMKNDAERMANPVRIELDSE